MTLFNYDFKIFSSTELKCFESILKIYVLFNLHSVKCTFSVCSFMNFGKYVESCVHLFH